MDTPMKRDEKIFNKLLWVYGIGRYRQNSNMNQTDISDAAGITQKMVSVWESTQKGNRNKTSGFYTILKVCSEWGITISKLCRYVDEKIEQSKENIEQELNVELSDELIDYIKKYARLSEGNVVEIEDEARDASEAHQKRLERYANKCFNGYYFHTNREDGKLVSMTIQTKEIVQHGYVDVDISADENVSYKGKLISPLNVSYTYIYINRMGDYPERGMIIFNHPLGSGESYIGGIAVVLSISKGTTQEPIFQKMVLIDEKIKVEDVGQFVEKHLKINELEYGEIKVQLSRFKENNAQFIRELKEISHFDDSVQQHYPLNSDMIAYLSENEDMRKRIWEEMRKK